MLVRCKTEVRCILHANRDTSRHHNAHQRSSLSLSLSLSILVCVHHNDTVLFLSIFSLTTRLDPEVIFPRSGSAACSLAHCVSHVRFRHRARATQSRLSFSLRESLKKCHRILSRMPPASGNNYPVGLVPPCFPLGVRFLNPGCSLLGPLPRETRCPPPVDWALEPRWRCLQ